jgi:hypothetical protein
MGEEVKKMLVDSEKTGERINKPIKIRAYVDYPENQQAVADFTLELSIKII